MPLRSLAEDAIAILKGNDREGGYTIPSPRLYPHQWAWDSAFAAIGWGHIDLDRALTELEVLLQGMWPNGMIPHIYFHHPSPDYFPGLDMWESPHDSSTITQPPVAAIAARRLYDMGADKKRLRRLLPKLEQSHRFFLKARDPLDWSCVAVVHPWESGLDNCPVWDRPLEAVDPERAPEFKRVDKERVADASERPTDEQYKRYLVLVKDLARREFEISDWAVYDPLMTAILIQAERDLAWLAAALETHSEASTRAARMKNGLLKYLWDADLQRFVYFDAIAQRPESALVIGSCLPALLDLPPQYQTALLETLRKAFLTPFGLSSTAATDPAYDPRCYWRGPIWVNTNWLMADILGDEVIQPLIHLVQDHGFFEYFDPRSGEGLGADQFSWTAALVLDLLRRTEQA